MMDCDGLIVAAMKERTGVVLNRQPQEPEVRQFDVR